VKFRLLKYLIPFIFLLIGIKGILCFDSSTSIKSQKVVSIKLPQQNTHSGIPDAIENSVTLQTNAEESNDDENHSFSDAVVRISNEYLFTDSYHSSSAFLKTYQLKVFTCTKIYLLIRVLLI
jgi:hypothetical protein